MKEFLEKLLRLFMEHRTGGEKAHPNATDRVSGFMPPDLYTNSRQQTRHRTWLDTPDLLNLSPGYYMVSPKGMKNGPVNNVGWYCDVDVFFSYDGRKNIWVYENVANRIHHGTVSSAGVLTWRELNTKTLLYSGNTDFVAAGTTLKLSESLENYKNLEIHLHNKIKNTPFLAQTNRTSFSVTETNIGEVSETSATVEFSEINGRINLTDGTVKISSNKSVYLANNKDGSISLFEMTTGNIGFGITRIYGLN